MTRTEWLLPLIALSACGPSDINIVNLIPELAVAPEEVLDFERVVVFTDSTGEVFFSNPGRAVLDVDLVLEGPDASAFSLDTTNFQIDEDGNRTVVAAFMPTELRPYEATIAIASNDPELPVYGVTLIGEGREPPAPEIEIIPGTQLDFGPVDVGSDEVEYLEIVNLGDAPLALGSIRQVGAGTFSMDIDPSLTEVAPGASTAVVVQYAPIQDQGDNGTLLVPSNDADEPEVSIELVANGGGTFEYPVAVIDCPGALDLAGPQQVHLDGTGSYDPLGFPLTYAWTLSARPEGADPTTSLDPVDQPETDLTVSVAGLWEVTLQVTNSVGTPSVPEKCILDAVPADQLYVELSWKGANADMDLHLARNDAGLFESPDDTSWCNTNPDWGSSTDPDDDPRLDLDDDEGYGPENINVLSPADGTYLVRVHHFDDANDGDVTAEVKIWTFGQIAWEGSKVLARNDVWDVGQVNWPDGTVGVNNVPPWDAGSTRECL